MSKPMQVDKKRTVEARKRHNAGVLLLLKACAAGDKGGFMAYVAKQRGAGASHPVRAGRPAKDDRRRARKRARAARRVNRG